MECIPQQPWSNSEAIKVVCYVTEGAGISSISVGINRVREEFWQTVNGRIIVRRELIDGCEVEVIVAQGSEWLR